MSTDDTNKAAKVINIQSPPPVPPAAPFGTPSPEDALIEVLDLGKKDKEDA